MKATIIGGGISGLTMALAFEKLGIDYLLYEKAPELNEVGAGIWVSTNAMQVFGWLDIAEQIKLKGLSLKRIEIVDNQFRVIQSTHQDIFKQKLGYSGTAIHRALLQKTLFEYIPSEKVFFDCEAENIVKDSNGKVLVKFKNGKQAISDFVVAADGIYSPVRNQLFAETKLRNSKQVCWRGISQMDIPDSMGGISAECWGNQIRFGFSPIAKGQVYWFAVVNSNHVKENFGKQEIKEIFSAFNSLVGELIDHTPKDAIIFRPLFDLKPIKQWHKGNIILVGDAAHATTPNMGQGAAQGIEDAYYLSQYLVRSSSVSEAFKRFEKNRRPKVNGVVNTSWTIGRLAHIKRGQKLRNFILSKTPVNTMEKRMMKLYSLKPL